MKSWVVSLLIFFFFSLFVSHLLRGRREGVLGALIANQPYVLFFFVVVVYLIMLGYTPYIYVYVYIYVDIYLYYIEKHGTWGTEVTYTNISA